MSKNLFDHDMVDALSRFIVVQRHAMPLALCDDIVEHYGSAIEWRRAATAGGSATMKMRNCLALPISRTNKTAERKRIDQEMFKCAGASIRYFVREFPRVAIRGDTGYDLLRYDKGGYYVQHVDDFPAEPRAVSCSWQLNDGFTGGGWGFFDRKFKLEIEKGDAVMFPSNFMFPHEILPVKSGVRFSIITWFR